jgi:F-type H+-transporting ATPase subunit b
VPQEDPKKKAQSLMDSIPVPGNSPLTKAAVLSAGAGLSIAAISNELYVVNEESIVALSLLTIFWAVAKYAGPAWGDYANQQRDKIAGILNAARADHTTAVKQRIQSVQDLGGVIDITKTLFEVSKVRLESTRRAIDRQWTAIEANSSIGDCQARGSGFRARAKDCHCARGQDCSRFVGPLRGPGQAEATARACRVDHRQD